MDGALEVLFTPADFERLGARDLSRTVCVVFDVLRATSSIVTALANGAEAILPVADIQEALETRQRDPELLLAGERDGLRIPAELTGGRAFDLGNSPLEFSREAVHGRRIAITTTNGTRALRACAPAAKVLAASFLNLRATTRSLLDRAVQPLLIVCSGTFEEAAYEDILGAGALCDQLWTHYSTRAADSAYASRQLFRQQQHDLLGAVSQARNGRRLLSRPDLRGDLPYCVQRDIFDFVARLHQDGWLRAEHEFAKGGPTNPAE